MNIVQALEDSNIFSREVTRTIKKQQQQQKIK